jgi:peptidoglycan/LPS O-acetylase OafA/YrhL
VSRASRPEPGAADPRPTQKYIAALDGVRGLAVIGVLLFHCGMLPAGWTGVQLFFVLSGFLITGILLDGRRATLATSMRRFYWRRSLRILPVLCLFLGAAALAWFAAGVPQSFPEDWPWLAAFAANFARLRPGDLGEAFVHMWSLAVEEQFYLLWPFAVLLLPMSSLRRVVVILLLGVPLARWGLFAWIEAGHGADYAGRAVYVLPLSQFDAFAAGAALAIWPRLVAAGTTRNLLAVTALVGLAGFAVLLDQHLGGAGAFAGSLGYAMYLVPAAGYAWGYSLLNLLFAVFIAAAIHEPWWGRWLAARPLAFVGRISYGLYVYHLPLLLVARHWFPEQPGAWWMPANLLVLAGWAVVSVAVAAASYRLVEKPILALKDRVRP